MRRPIAILATLLLAASLPSFGASTAAEDCDWPMYGRDPGHGFAQTASCSLITKDNVSTLKPKWFVHTPDNVTASPSVVDGVVYVGDWEGNFYAIDAETGEVRWTYAIDDAHAVAFGRIVSSAAVDEIAVPGAGRIRAVLFGGGGTLYALAADTGALLAKQDLDPRSAALRAKHKAAGMNPEIQIESSPVVGHFPGGDDRIFVGMDVHNEEGVGRTGLLSFRLVKAATAGPPYRFKLIYKFDPETRRVRTSLVNADDDAGYGCAGVWSSPALDQTALGPGNGVVYFGTSNCDNVDESVKAGEVGREGVWAIDAKNGALLWEYHPRGPNHLDDDFGASPNLLPGGLIGEGGKDGVYYAFSRLPRRAPKPDVAWTGRIGQPGHLFPGLALGGMQGTAAVGKVNGEHAIFVVTGISTPVGEPFDPEDPSTITPATVDHTLVEDPGRMLSLHAVDASDGRLLWRSPMTRMALGAPTYANGVVFVPSNSGQALEAFDADTGTMLWRHLVLGAPASAPAIVGDSIYAGSGTRAPDSQPESALYKPLGGVFAFELADSSYEPARGVLFNLQANQLDLYDLTAPVPGESRTTPIRAHEHSAVPPDDSGYDVNGQVCRFRQSDGSVRYAMGEDHDQSLGAPQGWGIFAPSGSDPMRGPWTMVDKLVPVYNFTSPKNDHQPENTGCVVGADGSMMFTVDLGNQGFGDPAVGSLFAWYRDADGNFSGRSRYCVLDNHLTTAGYIATLPDGSVLVPESGREEGGVVSRFAPPFPPDGTRCGAYDLKKQKSVLIKDPQRLRSPISVAMRRGHVVVASVFVGQIEQYDLKGNWVRTIAPPGPYNPAGIAVDAAGQLYFANLGLRPDPESVLTPEDGLGTVYKVPFDPLTDAPLPPILIRGGLAFPEGIAVFESVT